MNELVLPTIVFLAVSLIFLYISKKKENKDKLTAAMFTISSMVWVLLVAIMLYEDIVVTSQKWGTFNILVGILILLVVAESFECFGHFNERTLQG